MTLSEKQKRLDNIAKEIESCDICKKASIGVAVPGEGSANAKIMFVGEAPGKQEAKSGRPFIGRSGKLLREQIQQIGLDEKEVYITSPVKYLPERGTPSKQQIKHGRTHFDKQVTIIDPKLMVLMGKVASFAVLDKDVPISKLHGEEIEEKGKSYFLMYHPAAAIRFQKFRQTFINDFLKLKSYIVTNLE